MITLLICLLILMIVALPIGPWLTKHGLALLIPIFFSLVLIATLVMPLIGFNGASHWYDQVIAVIAFVYEWVMFFRRDRTSYQGH